MPGSIDLTLNPVDLIRTARQVACYRYFPEREEPTERLIFMPHVRLIDVTRNEGPDPWRARLRYVFDDEVLAWFFPSIPRRMEDVFGLNARSPWRVPQGARIVAVEHDPDQPEGQDFASTDRMVFDGFVLAPQANASHDSEVVTFTAVGTPIRCWDRVIETAPYRCVPEDPADDPVTVDVSHAGCWRFNPEGPNVRNCTRDDETANEDEDAIYPWAYPVFTAQNNGPEEQRKWTLDGAVRTLIWHHNYDEDFVTNPNKKEVVNLMTTKVPATEGAEIDDDDPETYNRKYIEIPDMDLTGKAWPDALWELIAPFGFTFRWELALEGGYFPKWHLVLSDKKRTPGMKVFKLAPAGSHYDPRATNVAGLSLSNDGEVANEWAAMTEPIRIEAAFILAPDYEIDEGDEESGSLDQWRKSTQQHSKTWQWDRYRVHVLGENYATYAVNDVEGQRWYPSDEIPGGTERPLISLESVLDTWPDRLTEEPPLVRGRPPRNELLTVKKKGITAEEIDPDGRGRPAELAISTDYAGDAPGIWNGEGTWQPITGGGWKLLEHRIGIELTDDDVEEWSIGKPPDGMQNPPFPSGVVRVVSCTANPDPDANTPRFFLRLTTTIDADIGLGAAEGVVAPYRRASPTPFTIRRADNVRDRYRLDLVHQSSPYFSTVPESGAFGAEHRIVRDDREKLRKHLEQRRGYHELAKTAGSLTVPYVTHAYHLGDTIKGLAGRFISFRQDRPTEAQPAEEGTEETPPDEAAAPPEAPVYPVVVGITWKYDGNQSTEIHLGDRRVEFAER